MADGDTFSGIGYARACMMDIHVQVEICTADGDTFSGIGYAQACMVDIHEVESGDMYGRWGYILWDRLGPSMHGGYPCTGGDMHGRWGYILWDRLCPSMHGGYP